MLNKFFSKKCRLRDNGDNVKKYGGGREATDGNKIRRMRSLCTITEAANARS